MIKIEIIQKQRSVFIERLTELVDLKFVYVYYIFPGWPSMQHATGSIYH